jgi:translation initiation factor 2B subunit (eIF-2B alpha/beta/delta family)
MSFEIKIKELLSDNYSGSAAILDKLMKSIQTYINSREIDTLLLREYLEKVSRSFPDLAVLHHFLQHFFEFLDRLDEHELSNTKKKLRIEYFISEYDREWDDSIDLAAERMARLIQFSDKRILLHSNSSSIHILFQHLAVRKIFPSVYQTMSGPVFEGKIQASFLADLGCKVHFINEAAVGRFIHEIDFAVVGADNVFTDGFTNKIGTYPIALVCKEANKPLYVICDSRKRSPVDYKSRTNAMLEKEAPAGELWSKAPESVRPVNYYFEFTPKNLVTAYFFEDSWLNVAESDEHS